MVNQWEFDERPWTDRDTLAEAYHDDRTTKEVADGWGCSTHTIYTWVAKFDLDRRESYGGDWTDEEKLTELYWGEGLSQSEMADVMGCEQSTVSKWMDEHDIPQRYLAKEYGQISTTEDGYEYFCVDCEMVWIHRLIMALEYDLEEMSGKQTHHKNGIPWDNRPENIELVSASEHINRHQEELLKARWGRRDA